MASIHSQVVILEGMRYWRQAGIPAQQQQQNQAWGRPALTVSRVTYYDGAAACTEPLCAIPQVQTLLLSLRVFGFRLTATSLGPPPHLLLLPPLSGRSGPGRTGMCQHQPAPQQPCTIQHTADKFKDNKT